MIGVSYPGVLLSHYMKKVIVKYDMDATVDLISNMGVSEEQALNYDETLMKLHDQQNQFHRIQQKNIILSDAEFSAYVMINSEIEQRESPLKHKLKIFKNIFSDYKDCLKLLLQVMVKQGRMLHDRSSIIILLKTKKRLKC